MFEEDDDVEAANKNEKGDDGEEEEEEKAVSSSLSAAMKSLAKLNEMMKMDELMMQTFLNKTQNSSLTRHQSLSNKCNDSLLKVAKPLFSPQPPPPPPPNISCSSSSSSSSPHLTNAKLSSLNNNEKLSIESYVMSQTASTTNAQTGIANKANKRPTRAL